MNYSENQIKSEIKSYIERLGAWIIETKGNETLQLLKNENSLYELAKEYNEAYRQFVEKIIKVNDKTKSVIIAKIAGDVYCNILSTEINNELLQLLNS